MSDRRLFVYGSLLRGERHHGFLRDAKGGETVRTEDGYALVDLGPYPGLVAEGSERVVGELHLVDASTLAALDRLEEHPQVYRRSEIRLSDGSAAEAYLFPGQLAEGRPRVSGGDWRIHRRERDSG